MRPVLVVCLTLVFSISTAFTQNTSTCVPACSSDQVCEQVFNTNNQYQCNSRSSPAASSSSPVVSGCGSGCAQGETCQQVYNTNGQYECVATAASAPQNTTAQSSPSPSPAASNANSGCNPACSASETCRQVFNTDDQYECVTITAPTAAATASPVATATAPSSSSTNASTGCNPACGTNERCRQVYNTDDQYECAAATSPAAAAAATPSTYTGLGICPSDAR